MGSLHLGNSVITPASINGYHNEDLTVTANGTYTPGEGVTGYGKVTVNVSDGTETVKATNNSGAALAVNDKVFVNKSGNVYTVVPFASATADSVVGSVLVACGAAGETEVKIISAN